MRFRRKLRPTATVEASSLSDILFFLLLFFLMIATLASPNAIKLLLPQSASKQQVTRNLIHVSVNANREYFIENDRIAQEELEDRLQAASAANPGTSVVLRIEKENSVQDLVGVADVTARLGIPMVLATTQAR